MICRTKTCRPFSRLKHPTKGAVNQIDGGLSHIGSLMLLFLHTTLQVCQGYIILSSANERSKGEGKGKEEKGKEEEGKEKGKGKLEVKPWQKRNFIYFLFDLHRPVASKGL